MSTRGGSSSSGGSKDTTNKDTAKALVRTSQKNIETMSARPQGYATAIITANPSRSSTSQIQLTQPSPQPIKTFAQQLTQPSPEPINTYSQTSRAESEYVTKD